VQETLLQAFTHLETFEYRGEGAFRAYLRQAVLNRIRDELRRAARHPAAAALAPNMPDGGPSPLETAIGREGTERYEAGMARLKAGDREVLIARLELGLSYPEIAEATGRTSANAARMAVVRALLRLTEELGHGLPDGKSS
jgi:RNA polymerase sigma-70 factor (ECF subfamily)